MKQHLFGFFVVAIVVSFAAHAAVESEEVVEETLDIAPVWAGHPVGFCLLTHGEKQFAAFYDAERRMTVAARTVGAKEWQFQILPEQVVWDSHNYVTMCVDDGGYIHLSGNMHVKPLVYFRTAQPLDIATFARVPKMVGSREDRCTYPQFMRGPDNALLFTYRDGNSGNGEQMYNMYDQSTQTWRRLIEEPLTSGKGLMNAYFNGPSLGPDGQYHLCWVWRDHGGCESNHDLSYARSKDLIHWTNSAGTSLALPMTIETAEIVDPVPVGGGIINGNTRLGFDSNNRVVIAYHKYDAQGNTQIYAARLEDGAWRIYQVSDWDYRWEFSGGGAIPFEVHVGGVSPHGEGQLTLSYGQPKTGSGVWILDENTMKPAGTLEKKPAYPRAIAGVESPLPGMQVQWTGDSGKSGEPGVRYVMRWETLGANRDRPREGELPGPSMLRLYKMRSQ